MGVSQKCQYALRALFELAKRKADGVIPLPEIAKTQAIPQRFLENIMHQLRQGRFIESRRGKGGGFFLIRSPDSINIADIIRFIDGAVYSVECAEENTTVQCPLKGSCVFIPLWEEARNALEKVYTEKTLQDLLDQENQNAGYHYSI